MHPDYKVPTVDKIDPVICAEIPDENEDPELYLLVKEHMIHGPCGPGNLDSPCMVDGNCSKNFPKQILEHTSIDSNGYPIYRRRNSGRNFTSMMPVWTTGIVTPRFPGHVMMIGFTQVRSRFKFYSGSLTVQNLLLHLHVYSTATY